MSQDNGKNIILCSDGTGNKGGYGADSNVYKLYKAIDLDGDNNGQYTFYENGVGTQSNTIMKTISGGLGFGFAQNVKDLYTFLAANYNPGDTIYLFGFSRGAATVRAFAGFVQVCGLLDRYKKNEIKQKGDGEQKEERTLKGFQEFNDEIEEAFSCYQKNNPQIEVSPASAIAFKNNKAVKHETLVPDGNVPIKMIGVWDTVSALGFTPDSKWLYGDKHAAKQSSSSSSWVLNLANKLFPHKFYNYQLNKNVEYVYHALALDDERLTFKPRIWREQTKLGSTDFARPQHIEQVWFSGMHSNVGGGYERTGLSDVALDWMLDKAQSQGLIINKQFVTDIKERANAHGKLYNSRDGMAMLYRYSPRNMTQLCLASQKVDVKNINVHYSALSRMKYRTAAYAPGELPAMFNVLKKGQSDIEFNMSKDTYNLHQESIQPLVKMRRSLYYVMLCSIVALVTVAIMFWIKSPTGIELPEEGVLSYVVTIGMYFLPTALEEFYLYLVLIVPELILVIVSYFIGLRYFINLVKSKHSHACQKMRNDWLGIKQSNERCSS